MSRPRVLFGHEYEVRCEDNDDGDIGWFRAKFMTSNARQEGWLWEIVDPRFRRDNAVSITDVRPVTVTIKEEKRGKR